MTIKITKLSTENKGKRDTTYKPDIIVCHITEGSYNGAVSWLQNPESQASANFVVSKTGHITQLVPIEEKAWCNGTQVTNPNGSNYYRNATNKYVKVRNVNANDYTISIECEGKSKENGGQLTDIQLKAIANLIDYIRKEVKKKYNIIIPINRNNIIGHYEISPTNKPNCPGKNFQWDKLIKTVKELDSPVNKFPLDKEIKLKNVKLYISSTASANVKKITGTYYLYDGKSFNKNRYRIVQSKLHINKFPPMSYVVGYINEEDIK